LNQQKINSVIFLLFTFGIWANGQNQITLQPQQFQDLVLLKGKKAPVYYALAKKEATTLQLVGPGELTVFTRVRVKPKEGQAKKYYLKYYLDQQRLHTRRLKVKTTSGKYQYRSKVQKGLPSKANKTTIQIPPGKHQITFYKHKTSLDVHARFVYAPSPPPDWQELAPLAALDPVEITHYTSQKKQGYHRIDQHKGFAFKAPQATRLRIFLRADFDYSMHNDRTLRLSLKENGVTIATYKIVCRKSTQVENSSNPDLIAGQLKKIYLDLPEAKPDKEYELFLKGNQSAIVRIFLDASKEKIQL
ncbi:MAG: hypothetical protein AAGD05_16375, partial [Bacteroidota bacterium]